ncbi:DUF2628 domain-containing protein [Hymenobacter sp. BT186]|uniref:DUF2628 domain-containing protein n=1 Tax=Hymenobacter telluris TaxID=2816474 RepID=A0A939EW51_9BACT|nr:DUF2628 domain-containing protein [Hymenobacter telluris]MBO0358131.1 DUF2628 domain-containing protein [Hymenobacter telluris]MBW3374158.1 DUF2628 domain-containing protein [Hymenobacter norwichensis]
MANRSIPIEIEDEHAWVFFGKNAEYYIQLWQLRRQGKILNFNISAFFAGVFWLAYRRMYFVLFLLLVVLFVEVSIEQAVLGDDRGQGTTIVINLIHASLLGLFGNAIYLWDAERKIGKVLRQQLPKEETLVRLRQAGSVSWWFLPVSISLVGAYVWLLKWLSEQPTL